jgi:hypothetical protein
MTDAPDDNQREFVEKSDDQEVDPELVALAEERASSSALRPLLFVAVIGLSIWVISDFWSEIEYFFSPSEPAEIGEVTKLAQTSSDEPNWSKHFPHNRYVSLSGIPKRQSESENYRYFKLVGVPVYVEDPLGEDEKDSGPTNAGPRGPTDRTYFEGKGRLIAFEKMPKRYNGVKRYYRKQYGTRFCETLSDREIDRIRNEKRTAVVDNWRKRYENASEQEREEKDLTREPTEQDIQEILNADPICVEAYLFRSTVEPSDNWEYLAVGGLFGLFMLLNVFWLVRWFRDFFRSDVDLSDLEEDEQ